MITADPMWCSNSLLEHLALWCSNGVLTVFMKKKQAYPIFVKTSGILGIPRFSCSKNPGITRDYLISFEGGTRVFVVVPGFLLQIPGVHPGFGVITAVLHTVITCVITASESGVLTLERHLGVVL